MLTLVTCFSAAPAQAASLVYIRGGGDGHGIGMSQYGAYGYALHGASYRAILAHYYQGTSLGLADPNQTVRVLISDGGPASFAGATSAGGTGLAAGQTYTVHALATGRLEIRDTHNKRVGSSFAAPLIVTGPGPLEVSGLGTYRGQLQFRPDGHGGLQTVDALALDDYVRGVVADEMPSSWAPQALEAQAVAARTYAITTAVGGDGYDLYDDTRSQMYGGIGSETSSTDAAVAATRGQIVTFDGRPAVTYFFASSGGYTESIQNVWPGATPEPWLRGVPDPYDGVAGDPYHRWGEQMSLKAAAGRLAGRLRGRLRAIIVTKHGISPRILLASVLGTRGRTTVSGGTLQQVFGLPTTYAAFTVITTNATPGALTGTVAPGRAGATYKLQALTAGRWHTLGSHKLTRGGSYRVRVPAPGRYRIQLGGLGGPAISVRTMHDWRLEAMRRQLSALARLGGHGPALPQGTLARYAWPLAGHRRPLRPLPLLLRAAGLHHRRR